MDRFIILCLSGILKCLAKWMPKKYKSIYKIQVLINCNKSYPIGTLQLVVKLKYKHHMEMEPIQMPYSAALSIESMTQKLRTIVPLAFINAILPTNLQQNNGIFKMVNLIQMTRKLQRRRRLMEPGYSYTMLIRFKVDKY